MRSVPGESAERLKLDDARRVVDALGVDDSAIVLELAGLVRGAAWLDRGFSRRILDVLAKRY